MIEALPKQRLTAVGHRSSRPVAIWLMAGVFMIIVQIILGGITRLTDSGLSITEWQPILGTVPPLNEAEWNKAFEGYKQIAKLNILNASFKSMHLAVKALPVQPQLLLIDGNRFTPYRRIPHRCIVGGDGKYASIAAASILAKTYRDDYMKELHLRFPQYNWEKNKGYATKDHQKALSEFGPCRFHRKSFRLNYSQPVLFTRES